MINLAEKNKDITRYEMMSEDQRSLQVSEARNVLIFKTDYISLQKPLGSDSSSYVVTHNLGYVPAFIAYTTTNNSSYIPIPYSTIAGSYYETIDASVDDTTLTLTITYADPGGILSSPDITVKMRYYIFREKAK